MKGGWEIPRKLFHFSIGFLVLYLYMNGIDTSDVYPKLVALLSIVGTAELLRFNFEWFNVIYCHVLGPLMRTTEIKTRINGVVYYLLGCIIVLYSFPRDLAALSIIYLSWADPVASICGKLWGKYTLQYGGKSLAGSLGAITIGSLVTYAYFGPLSNYHALSYNSITSPIPLIILSIYGGLVAGFSEGIGNSMFGLDDNLTIPVLSGILLWTPLIGFSLGQ
ncbi:hypothetical protein G6F46_010926 [Rhizopus delemar]|uniref:Phosphatidate cytidylyltransferase n=2 Tax=Rhizopus TaxID=4842 RepID=A0A9P6YUV0_9FUNG|nr:hypothetical protein G6F43_011241 [Rhizopus delemar]KAG1541788.1 hypothetical protein G6F51_007673 [Rhizopus arrhizus]KAG1449332.1 hypothetical protein G6F55_010216 [Rhizopus delemar]KAG1490774.1 hypothetical protein G6F54_010485 [Rhizopus delemar]KAG1503237.1 hypothetical protein G6F53_010673 [Rhizopus delemar]